MWQRKQTLFLLLIAVLSAVQCFVPSAYVLKRAGEAQIFQFKFPGLTDAVSGEVLMNTWWLYALLFIVAALAVVTILLYRRRMLQARLCVINLVLMLGYYALLAWHLWVAVTRINAAGAAQDLGAEWHLLLPSSFPLVCVVLCAMSIRAILKDEALVRAADRIR